MINVISLFDWRKTMLVLLMAWHDTAPGHLLSEVHLHVLCIYHFDGLVQERRNSIANALELRLSCTNPSTCAAVHIQVAYFKTAVTALLNYCRFTLSHQYHADSRFAPSQWETVLLRLSLAGRKPRISPIKYKFEHQNVKCKNTPKLTESVCTCWYTGFNAPGHLQLQVRPR